MLKKYIKFLDKMAKKLSPRTLKHTLLFGLFIAAIITIPVLLTTSVMALVGASINPLMSFVVGGLVGGLFTVAKAYGDIKDSFTEKRAAKRQMLKEKDNELVNQMKIENSKTKVIAKEVTKVQTKPLKQTKTQTPQEEDTLTR